MDEAKTTKELVKAALRCRQAATPQDWNRTSFPFGTRRIVLTKTSKTPEGRSATLGSRVWGSFSFDFFMFHFLFFFCFFHFFDF